MLTTIFNTLIFQPIFNLLFGIYSLIPGRDLGVAIIIFTILIRLALWPLVKKQLHQVKAMQKIQPELAKIKAQTKGNRQLESMQMMELYKKHGVNPFGSIGVLIIQLPIFITLYQVINIFIMQSNSATVGKFVTEMNKFIYGFMKGTDFFKDLIANPQHFNPHFLGFLDITKNGASTPFSINNVLLILLAVGAAVTQYYMSKQTMPQKKTNKKLRELLAESADGKTANQAEMNAAMMGKMTKFMPIMMFFIMYRLPGALALYYTASNIVAVIQQGHILKGDSEEMIEIADEASESGKGTGKKATAKAREKLSREATIVKITAKDDGHRVRKQQ